MMKKRVRELAALVVYCLVFIFLLVILYPLLLDGPSREVPPWEVRPGPQGRVAAGHVPSALEQRQMLGLYEDNQSPSSESYSLDKSGFVQI